MRAYTPYYIEKSENTFFLQNSFVWESQEGELKSTVERFFQLNVDGILLHHIFTKYPEGLRK